MAEEQTATVRVVLAGEFDLSSQSRLTELLQPALEARYVTLDLSRTTYLDSAALSCFVAFSKELEARGGRMVLEHVPRTIRRILEITRLDHVFEIVD